VAWRGTLPSTVITLQGSLLAILFGLQPGPGSIPLLDLIRQHAAVVLVISLLLFGAVIAFVLKSRRGGEAAGHDPTDAEDGRAGRRMGSLVLLTSGLSTLSTTACGVLLFAVLARPSWCPDRLCLPGEEPGATRDANLAAAFVAEQSSLYLIPDDPAGYSLGNLPPTKGASAYPAQPIVAQPGAPSQDPYRIELSVRNLEGSPSGILIEGMGITVDSETLPPSPTRVWLQPAGTWDLQLNPYEVTYQGESRGAQLRATDPTGMPPGRVHLDPAERDYLTLTIASTTAVMLRFRIQVAYRVLSERSVRTLTLRDEFQAVFADDRRWTPYQLVDGHLLPA
jgi:hypothetical protein